MTTAQKSVKAPKAGAWTVTNFLEVFEASPQARVGLVRKGVNPSDIKAMIRRMDVSQDWLFSRLKLSAATVNRKTQEGKSLSADDSERVVGISRLIGQAQAMVDVSGDPKGFDSARWVGRWLDTPLPALGGEPPGNYMDTMEGQAMVANLLARASSGTYA